MRAREIVQAAVMGVVGVVVASQCAQAQTAELAFSGGSGIVCPAPGASVLVGLFNRSGSSQTIGAGTAMQLDFPAPVTGAQFSRSSSVPLPVGAYTSVSGKRVTVYFQESVTTQNNSNSFLLVADLDLRGVRSGTPIAVTVTTSPSTAVTLEGGVNTIVESLADAEACQPAPTSAFTIDDLAGTCPSAQEVAAFNAALEIRLESDPSAGRLVCRAAEGSADLTRLQERTYQVLRVMQFLPFDTPLPWTSKSLYAWFTGAIRGIRYRGDISGSFCCEPAGFINLQTGNLAVLTSAPDPYVLVNLAGLFVHEARHNEVGGHTCGSNDLTLTELGSWGVQYYFNEWAAFRVGSFLTRRAPPPPYPFTFYRQRAWGSALALLWSGDLDCGPGGTLGGGVVVSPVLVDFGTQALFAASSPRSVAITLTQGGPVTIGVVSLSGAQAGDFSVTSAPCVGTTLPPSCAVVLRFTPSAAGLRTAQLTTTLNNGLRRTVELRGTGG